MRRWTALFLCSLLLFLLQFPVRAAEFGGTWKYRVGNSPYDEISDVAWVYSAMRGDAAWQEFPFPKQPALENGERYLWITVKLLPEEREKNTLFFLPVNQSFRVWFNNQMIYEYGIMKHTPLGYGRGWYMLTLPETEDVSQLTIQLYSDSSDEVGMFNDFCLDTGTEQIRHIFYSDLSRWLALPVALLMLMILAVYYFSPMAWKRLYLYGIFFLVIMVFWMLGTSNVRQFWMDDVVFWWFCTKILHYLLPVTLDLVAYEVLEEKYRGFMQRVLSGYLVFIGIAVLEEIFGFSGLTRYIPLYYVLMVGCQAAVCYWLFRSGRAGNSYSKAMLVAVVSLTVFQLADGLSYLHVRPLDSAVTPWGVYAFFIFVMRLIYDQLEGKQELESATVGWAQEVTQEQVKSEVDPLTSCYNRGKYEETLAEKMKWANGTGKNMSLILMDIDHFKYFNDTYGHEMGDVVLKNFAQCIREKLDGRYPLFRWGGEEFVVLCSDMGLSIAAELADSLRQAIAQAPLCDKQQVTCSVGVSTWHHGIGDTEEEFFRRADDALYRAKENGRNCVYQESWVF